MSIIQTNTGRYFNILQPYAHNYAIREIAAALSKLCRFTGHVDEFYSVAQHSVFVSMLVPPEHAMEALLHDASEAYLGDVASPLKAVLPGYKAIEKSVERAIALQHGLPLVQTPCVKAADMRALVTEKRDLMPSVLHDAWCWPDVEPWAYTIFPVGPERAARDFIYRYWSLKYGEQ